MNEIKITFKFHRRK